MKRINIFNKKSQPKFSGRLKRLVMPFAFAVLLANFSCSDDKDKTVTPATINANNSISYEPIYLVSDIEGLGASRIDTNLVNAWGIAVEPNGNYWISSTEKGRSVIYDKNGGTVSSPVAIPSMGDHLGGSPTGVVYNGTTSFVIPSKGESAKFIFVSEDGIISAWSSGDSAVIVADRSSSGAVYKGVAIAEDGGINFLYATNFKGQKIDVFDQNFNYITSKPFTDPSLPAGYGPFNITNIDGSLYVTYAKLLGPDNEDDEAGPGNGYVNVFSPNGSFIKRFASGGMLNSPWGIAKAPENFGQYSNTILIGNFGDGHITVFDTNGGNQGQLQSGFSTIIIDGLWALNFNDSQLYFTAGPNDEQNGLFGYIRVQGNYVNAPVSGNGEAGGFAGGTGGSGGFGGNNGVNGTSGAGSGSTGGNSVY